jgi:solute carrier family 35 protein C2
MAASVLGGLRWSLTQILLERTDTKSGSLANPISTIFFLSPIMGVCLCIVAGIFEGFGTIFGSHFFATAGSAVATLGLLLLGGIFAFMMVLAEFNLIARTSVVTLSVLGIIKVGNMKTQKPPPPLGKDALFFFKKKKKIYRNIDFIC